MSAAVAAVRKAAPARAANEVSNARVFFVILVLSELNTCGIEPGVCYRRMTTRADLEVALRERNPRDKRSRPHGIDQTGRNGPVAGPFNVDPSLVNREP